MKSTRQQDIDAWKKWKKDPSPQNLDNIMHQLNPLIQSEVNRWQGVLSPTTLKAKAKLLTVHALHTFNDKKNVPLSVHTMNNLKKLSRTTYSFQNVARIPEHRTLKISSFNRAENELTENLGRIPSTAEVADRLGWRETEIIRMRKDLRKELVGSEPISPNAIDEQDSSERQLSFIYHTLNPEEQSLMEVTTGYNGQKVLQNNDIQKKFGWTPNQLSYKKKKLIKKIKDLGA